MKLKGWKLIGSLVVASSVAMGLAGLAALHFDPLCGEEPGYEITSPSGRYVAASMVRNCGATTSYVTHVNLRTASSKFHPGFLDGTITEGEIATFDKYDGRVVFCWLSDEQLNIELPLPQGRRSGSTWTGINVTYGKNCP